MTYPIDEIDAERARDWKKEQQKEKNRKKKNSKTKVRANWSPKKHSLKAFFAAHKTLAKKVKIVGDTGAHVIDLGDKLGF